MFRDHSRSEDVKMAKRVSNLDSRKRVRRFFGHLSEVAEMPNLIEVQRSSYDQFLQLGISREERQGTGLQEAFASVFPIMTLRVAPCFSLSLTISNSQNTMLRNVSSAA